MGLIAHYPLDGDARDVIGGNDGELMGSPSWSPGKFGMALNTNAFNGGYIRAYHNERVSQRAFGVTTSVTLAAWVKLRSFQSYGLIVGKNSGSSFSNTTNAIWVTNTGVRFVVASNESGNPSGSVSYAYAGSAFALNTWHHVTAVLDGDRMRFYVDGVMTDDAAVVVRRPRSENTSHIIIGGPRTSGNESIDGEIHDVRIYDHALSPREVRDLSLAPTVQELIGSASSEPVTVPASPAVVGDTTIAFWMKPASSSTRQTIWNKGYGGEGTINFETSGHLRFYSGPNGGNSTGYAQLNSSSGIPLNQWTHAVIVRDMAAKTWTWYLNGEPDTTGSFSFETIGSTNFDLSIGTGYTSDFAGELRDVRQFASVLTQDQVRELYRSAVSIDSGGSAHTAQLTESTPVGIYTSPSGGSHDGSYGLRFTVDKPTVITSCLVRSYFTGQGSALLYDFDNQESPLQVIDFEVVSGRVTFVDLGLYCVPGVRYWLTALGGSFMRSSDGIAFPIKTGPITFERGTNASGASATRWYYFFDIHYRESNAVHREGLSVGVSEVGPAADLMAWYPLIGDSMDYAGANSGIASEVTLDSEGVFLGVSGSIRSTAAILPSSGEWSGVSLSAWVRPEDFTAEGWLASQWVSGDPLRFIWNTTTGGRMRYFVGGQSVTGGRILSLGEWVHVVATRDAEGAITLYVDGEEDGRGTVAGWYAGVPFSMGNVGGNSGASLSIRDVRVYRRALSADQVALLHRHTSPTGPKVLMTPDSLYLKSQLKEVIA